jgi:hypothetical protein
MKRTNQLLTEVARILQDRYGFTGPSGERTKDQDTLCRRLERWSQAGLFPASDWTADEIARHIGESGLVEVYRSGPGAADRALFILAGRGYACEGLADALRRLRGDANPVEQPPNPWTDEGSRAIEDEVGRLTSWPGDQSVPPLIAQFVKAFVEGALENCKRSPYVDPRTEEPEPADVTRAVGITQALSLLFGGAEAPVFPEAVAAISAMAPPVPDDAEGHVDMATAMDLVCAIGNHAPAIEAGVDRAYAASAAELVKGAQLMRVWLNGYSPAAWLPAALRGAEMLDYLAGVMAPQGLALSQSPLGPFMLLAADPTQWGTNPLDILESLELPDSGESERSNDGPGSPPHDLWD